MTVILLSILTIAVIVLITVFCSVIVVLIFEGKPFLFIIISLAEVLGDKESNISFVCSKNKRKIIMLPTSSHPDLGQAKIRLVFKDVVSLFWALTNAGALLNKTIINIVFYDRPASVRLGSKKISYFFRTFEQ